MESFLPSEIARLVYGYLEEEGCPTAAQTYLETSNHLKECLSVAKKGRKFNTKIYGLSLIDLLDLLTETVSFVKEHRKELKEGNMKDCRLLTLLQLDTTGGLPSSGNKESLSDNNGRVEDSSVSVIQNTNGYCSNSPKDTEPILSESTANDTLHNDEGNVCRVNSVISSPKIEGSSSLNFKIKEEENEEGMNINGANYEMEDCNQNVLNIEPEVEITSPASDMHGNFSRQDAPTVNVITNPIMVSGRPSQLLCQPYNMVQMLPTGYPNAINPNISAVYFPHGAISQHPVMSVQHQPSSPSVQPALYQTAVRTSESGTVQSVWPNNNDSSQSARNTSKLRPIAPKITQTLNNAMKVQVVHAKENSLVETKSYGCKRNLRSRKRTISSIPSKSQCFDSLRTNDKK